MESSTRHQNNPLNRLIDSPQHYNFFQAIRILSGSRVKFIAAPALDFSASSLKRISYLQSESDSDLLIVEQSIMALAGQNGVLPDHITELMFKRMSANDSTLRDFLDLFNNHLTHLFVKSWRTTHFFVNYEMDKNQVYHDTTLSVILALTGQSRFALQDQDIDPEAIIYYSGLLSHSTRHAEGLKLILEDYFEIPISISEFSGTWVDVKQDECSRLGKTKQYNSLGIDTMIGTRFWHIKNKFEINIGPLHYADFEQLLPNGDMLQAVEALVKLYCGIEFQFSIRLLLHAEQVPALQLQKKNPLRLGWNSWFGMERLSNEAVSVASLQSRSNSQN